MNLRTYKHHSSLTINIETTRSIVKNMSMDNISYCIQVFTNIKSSSVLQYLIFCKNVARQAITSKELSSYRMKTLTSSVCCFQILSTFKCKHRYQIVYTIQLQCQQWTPVSRILWFLWMIEYHTTSIFRRISN